jgi:hypothetical protein
MGWGARVARSHASRLEREGWVERHPLLRGDGSLLIATRRGVRMTGLPVTAPAAAPEPAWWAHDCACAWTAAWLTVRGAPDWQGPREVLIEPELKGTMVWSTRVKRHRSGHRPDLTVGVNGGVAAVEVELQRKQKSRLEGILTMYRGWIAEGKISGVVYVCGSDTCADRVYELAARVGIPARERRIELLRDVREQAQSAGSRSVAGSGGARGT